MVYFGSLIELQCFNSYLSHLFKSLLLITLIAISLITMLSIHGFGTLMSYYLIVVIWYLVTEPDLIILLVLLVTLLLYLALLLGPLIFIKGAKTDVEEPTNLSRKANYDN